MRIPNSRSYHTRGAGDRRGAAFLRLKTLGALALKVVLSKFHFGSESVSTPMGSIGASLVRRFFSEVRRVGRPNALPAAYGYSWFYLTPGLDELANRRLLQPIERY